MPHYVIIGAGFGALAAVNSLRRKDLDAEITVIAPEPRFMYYPSLIWVPSGVRTPEDLTVDLNDFFARNGVTYHQGRVQTLEDGGRTVVTDTGRVTNDGLIVAPGGRFMQKLPGIENVLTVCQGGASAQAIGERLAEMDGGRIAVGFAGNPKHRAAMRGGAMFELLFCIHNQLRREGRRDNFELTFFTPAPRPGVRLGERAADGVLKRFEAINATAHLGHAIQRFEPDRVVTDGGEIMSDLTLFMPGMTGPAWAEDSPLPLAESGHIEVDARGKVPGLDAVYAVGDAAAFPGPDWQAKQAHAAEVQGGTAAANLIDELAGKAPRKTVRHEIVCILDSLEDGVPVFRNNRVQLVLPPMKAGHWGKIALEKFFLYKYGARRRARTASAAPGQPASA